MSPSARAWRPVPPRRDFADVGLDVPGGSGNEVRVGTLDGEVRRVRSEPEEDGPGVGRTMMAATHTDPSRAVDAIIDTGDRVRELHHVDPDRAAEYIAMADRLMGRAGQIAAAAKDGDGWPP